MSDELRDRIEQIIENKTYAMAPDGFIAGTEEAAQAIIDDLGLEWEQRLRTWDDMDGESRVVGRWA